MNLRNHHGQMSESLLTASFIILSGGLQDAYTYLCRGKVFANAQTGNIVLCSAYLFDGHRTSDRASHKFHFCWGSSRRSASTAISSTRRRCTGGR